MSSDITFCGSQCGNTDCPRHMSHMTQEPYRWYSVADFGQDCPERIRQMLYIVRTKDEPERVTAFFSGWSRQLPITTIDFMEACRFTDKAVAENVASQLDTMRMAAFHGLEIEPIWTVEENNDE